jgi:intracellular septation protein
MKLLFDFFPILLFFVAYKLAGIYVATGVAIAVSAAQVGWGWLRHRRLEKMQLVTLGLLSVFGGLTIALHDPIFVMWKPTIINWLFGGVFLASQWLGDRPLAQRMMGHAVDVPGPVWSRLNLSWSLFFILLGLANLYVVYMGSDFFGSGFYQAQQTLLRESGLAAVDLKTCASQFAGDLLGLCEDAHQGEGVWVNFKLFGMMGLTILFVIAQALYLSRHMKDEPEPAETD